jgi:hypothetical protein
MVRVGLVLPLEVRIKSFSWEGKKRQKRKRSGELKFPMFTR